MHLHLQQAFVDSQGSNNVRDLRNVGAKELIYSHEVLWSTYWRLPKVLDENDPVQMRVAGRPCSVRRRSGMCGRFLSKVTESVTLTDFLRTDCMVYRECAQECLEAQNRNER